MIQNERQYEITKKKRADMKAAAADLRPDNMPEVVWRGHQNGIAFLIADLTEYEKLREGSAKSLRLQSVLENLPAALVQAHVVRGWSHKDLARALGYSEQQVQKDESGGYARASLSRLHRVAGALNLRIDGQVRLSASKAQSPKSGPKIRAISKSTAGGVSAKKKTAAHLHREYATKASSIKISSN